MLIDITKFHRVDAQTWRWLQAGAGIAAIVALGCELLLVCAYGWTLGSDVFSSTLYVLIFALFTAIYAFGVPAASGAAERGTKGLPVLLLILWLMSAILQGASVYGRYQDTGEFRRIEAVQAAANGGDARTRYEEAKARADSLKSAPSVRAAETKARGLEDRLNNMRRERDTLPENYRAKRADLTLQIAGLEGDLAAARTELASAQDRADAERERADALKALNAAATHTINGAASVRIGDTDWYRWLRTIGHLAASFLCPLVWLLARHELEKTERSTMSKKERAEADAKKTAFSRFMDILERGAARFSGRETGDTPPPPDIGSGDPPPKPPIKPVRPALPPADGVMA